jgi:hypothetical protein
VNVANEVVNIIDYKVKPLTPVNLTITVGDGQVGGSSVRFKGEKIGGNGVTDCPIPRADDEDKELKDRRARCTTTVERKNQSTEQCSVTYSLRGGVEDKTYTFKATLQMGELADFNTTIRFE